MLGDLERLEQLDLDLGEGFAITDGDGKETALCADAVRARSEQAMRLLDARFSTAENEEAAQQDGLNQWRLLYGSLRDMGWPWRVAAYIAWEASPKLGRWPETVKDLATQVLGLTSDRQIYTWRQKNPMIEELIVKMRTDPLMAHLPKIWQAFIDVATTADYKSIPAMRMAFEMAGIYREQKEIHHFRDDDEQDLETMSYEELIDLERRLRTEQAGRGVLEISAHPSGLRPPPFTNGSEETDSEGAG